MGSWLHLSNSNTILSTAFHLCVLFGEIHFPLCHMQLTLTPYSHSPNYVLIIN